MSSRPITVQAWHVRDEPGPDGQHGISQRGQRVTEPGRHGATTVASTSRSTAWIQATP